MPKFKVGDRVYVDGTTASFSTLAMVHVTGVGTVKEEGNPYIVIMDKPFVDENKCTRNYFAAWERELSLIEPANTKDTKLVFYIKDHTVHCKLFSTKGLVSHTQAKCSPDDTFDFLTGVQIALQRMLKEQNKELVLPTLKNIKFINFN
jgi:hypothetical protein